MRIDEATKLIASGKIRFESDSYLYTVSISLIEQNGHNSLGLKENIGTNQMPDHAVTERDFETNIAPSAGPRARPLDVNSHWLTRTSPPASAKPVQAHQETFWNRVWWHLEPVHEKDSFA